MDVEKTILNQIVTKLITEMPVLFIYLISARWVILQLKDLWTIYIAKVSSKEDEILSTASKIIVKLGILDSEQKNNNKELENLRDDFRRLNMKVSDIMNKLNLKNRQDDRYN